MLKFKLVANEVKQGSHFQLIPLADADAATFLLHSNIPTSDISLYFWHSNNKDTNFTLPTLSHIYGSLADQQQSTGENLLIFVSGLAFAPPF